MLSGSLTLEMLRRIALRHAAADPAVAAAAVQTWTHSSSSIVQQPSETAPPDGTSDWPGIAGHEHAEHLAEIVAVTSRACWQAIEEEDRLRPDQYEAFLQAFLAPHLFTAQQPPALR